MKHFCLILLCGVIAWSAPAQTAIQKTFDFSVSYDAGLKILPASGGYVIFGNRRQSATDTNRDAFFLRVNTQGEQMAYYIYGSSSASEGNPEGMGMVATPDGWILATNKTENVQNAPSEAWLLRINTTGAILWSQTVTFSGLNKIALSQIAPVPGGGYIACGFGVIGSGRQMIALKISDTGTVEWSKQYGPGAGAGLYVSPGGSNCFIAGGNKIWKLRTNTGNIVWEKTVTPPPYGAPTGTVGIDLNDIAPTADGEFAVAGMISNDDLLEYTSAFYVATWTEAGAFRWDRLYHSSVLTGFSPNEASSIQYLPNAQELLLGGVSDGHLRMTRISLRGQIMDDYTVPASGEFFNPCIVKAGPYYAATAGILTSGANVNTFFFRSAGNALELSQGGGNTTSPVSVFIPDGLRLYPNPAKDIVTVEWKADADGVSVFRLTDMAGRSVWQTQTPVFAGFNQMNIDLQQLTPGVYWLQTGQDNVPAQILLKQ